MPAGIRLLFDGGKADPFVIFYKEGGLPSAPKNKTDRGCTAASLAAEICPALRLLHCGRAGEYGLIHRLDTAASGLLLFARTEAAFEALLHSQQELRFVKEYAAHCERMGTPVLEGFPPCSIALCSGARLYSAFRPFGKGRKVVRPVLYGSRSHKEISRPCLTRLIEIREEEKTVHVRAAIERGFRHQVRCHLAWAGLPVFGDRLYNPHFRGEPLRFVSDCLRFPHPLSGRVCEFRLLEGGGGLSVRFSQEGSSDTESVRLMP